MNGHIQGDRGHCRRKRRVQPSGRTLVLRPGTPVFWKPTNRTLWLSRKPWKDVQAVVRLANAERIPIVPMGNGMALTGLVRPLKGGIVLDMKRMNRILEVNERGRYAVVEGGASPGAAEGLSG